MGVSDKLFDIYFILKKMTPWKTISAPLLFNNKCFKQVLLNLIPRNMLKHYQKIRPPYCILTFRERAVSGRMFRHIVFEELFVTSMFYCCIVLKMDCQSVEG